MTHFFGGLRAVHNYDLEIGSGQVRGLIGPNGAGKTTIFNLITGIYQPTEGNVFLENNELNGLSPHEIAAMGIGRTFQNMLLWRHMTVLEHVKMARYSKIGYGLIGAFFGTARRHQEEAESEEKAYRLLKMLGVDQFADQWGPGDGAQNSFSGRAHRRHEPGGTGPNDGNHSPGPR
jgi:branched-chain amino acid transport system ATP-binding protein